VCLHLAKSDNEFYLKDVSVVLRDMSRLGPLAVAQHVIE